MAVSWHGWGIPLGAASVSPPSGCITYPGVTTFPGLNAFPGSSACDDE